MPYNVGMAVKVLRVDVSEHLLAGLAAYQAQTGASPRRAVALDEILVNHKDDPPGCGRSGQWRPTS